MEIKSFAKFWSATRHFEFIVDSGQVAFHNETIRIITTAGHKQRDSKLENRETCNNNKISRHGSSRTNNNNNNKQQQQQ